MSAPQDGPARVRQKRRRTKKLDKWREKQAAAASAPKSGKTASKSAK